MTLTDARLDELADHMHEAAMSASPVPMLSLSNDGLDEHTAYTLQRKLIGRRIEAGHRLVGMKMGLISKAKMQQMGVHSPIYGHLTADMLLENGGTLQKSAHCHPRVEPEIAFILGRDLEGPVSPAQALLAVEGVCAALEIIDSRYANFKFALADVVADNASSARFVLGDTVMHPADVELGNLGMVMEVDGKPVQIGSSAAIYDHPANSLAAQANMLAARGEKLHAGQIVLAGGATAAVALEAWQRVRLRVAQLGTASFSVEA